MNILGIDPGLTGALAFIDDSGYLYLSDMPTDEVIRNKKKKRELNLRQLAYIIKQFPPGLAFVEKVGAGRDQGTSSMFSFGKSTGAVLAASVALNWSVTEVPPQTWKKHFGLIGQEKDAARILAGQKFKDKLIYFARKKDHGRADAALIALYGRSLNG